ncbi:Flavoprotein YCP4 [Phytophthora cinnamomi]|uniref:Flavoprotein YCP4 n=1 Tax=Phytophthora cinnamomi TaxID=4785 RepID=UPI00355A41ED|nr:Flavoprotein YCP4 [Phytophthora cinnamomi]
MDTCPDNFDRHEGTNTCWAKCPIDYPVECGMECIRQNDDCAMEVLNKVGAIGNTVLAIATFGAFQKLWHVAENVRFAFDCANIMIGTMRSIIRYVRNIKTTDPTASTDKILNILYQSHNVVTDLPMAIMLCTRHNPPRSLDVSGRVLSTMNWILLNAIGYKEDLVSSWARFKAFLIGANFTEAANSINETEIGTLSDAFKTNSSCAYDLRSLTDRTWLTVKQLKDDNPGISEDNLRLKMQKTELVTSDISLVTNNCMEQFIAESDEATAYKTRDTIRKAFSGMINDLVSTGKSRNGSDEDAKNFMYQAVGKTMISIAVTGFDMIGLMGLIVTYLQRICGPTNFIGEIDDGTHPDTLGLNMIQKAFKNSTMSWTRKGDGQVLINFTSTDTKNVTVNIMSGGNKIDEVDVAAGGKATWNSTVKKLGGKTLYMDRWRPGFLGLPGTGGGSLLLWVPQAAEGGHLDLEILLNVIACDDEIVSSWEKFKVFLTAANFTETANEINDTEIATLSDALKSNSTCGFDLKSLADRTWMTVAQFRADNPDITEDEPRLKMEDSQLVTYGIGIATNNCMEQVIQESDEATAYTTRDTIRKAFSGMINDLISTGKSDNGSSETAKEFTHKAFDKAFTSIAVTGFDLTGISGLLAEYLQTICDPTRFIGEVDDDTDAATLGLNTIQDAFNDSSSSWTRMGDGQVIINISSFDTKNVTVNIISGGDKIDEVTVAAGGTATWVSNNTALGGKTLYLDRWRPGLFGIPGTRGGSLLLWAPKASQVGHLEIQAKLNVS